MFVKLEKELQPWFFFFKDGGMTGLSFFSCRADES